VGAVIVTVCANE